MAKFGNGNSFGKKSSRKGVPNKTTSTFGELIKGELTPFLEDGRFKVAFNGLTGKEQLEIVAKFMPYLAPKLQSTNITTDENSGSINISFNKKD
jgi:hypothetical protein